MVARRAEKLREHVAELVNEGLEAAAFPADLNDLSGIPSLVQSIERQFGGIDVAVYAPIAPDIAFVPAANLDAQTLRPFMDLYTYAPIQVANAVLQGQLARGDGAIVVVDGLTAVHPIAGMSGFGPAMAAARNYVHTLNAELAAAGVYAGTVTIGALIQRSASFDSMTAAGDPIVAEFPVINPDDIAEEIWTMVTKRDRIESFLPAIPDL